MRTDRHDGQTDMTQLIVAVPNVPNAPKNSTHQILSISMLYDTSRLIVANPNSGVAG